MRVAVRAAHTVSGSYPATGPNRPRKPVRLPVLNHRTGLARPVPAWNRADKTLLLLHSLARSGLAIAGLALSRPFARDRPLLVRASNSIDSLTAGCVEEALGSEQFRERLLV
ncbi:hypothetical protein NL676_037792 [Syzygium grande]|nr:hypothetical protein NL676_037792 [Syzygium grande]